MVIQKSLREGFGLSVAEALWKKKPVAPSAVRGIPTQAMHKHTGDDVQRFTRYGASISLKNRRLAAPSASKVPLPSMESPPWYPVSFTSEKKRRY